MERNWAELPRDLLGRILKQLCITSIISVKHVCQPWHSVVREEAELSLLRPVPTPPWLTIPPQASASDSDEGEEGQNSNNKKSDSSTASFFNLTNKKVYFIGDGKEKKKEWRPPPITEAVCVGSSHGWLAFVDFRCVIYLTNPFKFKFKSDESSSSSSSTIIQLPSIETLPCILGVERSSSTGIDFAYKDSYDKEVHTVPSNNMYHNFVTKLVMSSAPPSECTVMIIYGELNDIAFCKLGDTSWTTLNGRLRCYYDLYYSSKDQLFYAYCKNTWSVEAWDLSDSSSPKISTFIQLHDASLVQQPSWMTPAEKRLRFQCTKEHMYLMELHGDLLLAVKRTGKATPDGQLLKWHFDYNYYEDEDEEEEDDDEDDDDYDSDNDADDDEENVRGSNFEHNDNDYTATPYKTFCFDVYKLDWVKKQWVQMKSLGDGDDVLFVGVNNTIAFSACDFPELKGNSIYFTDDNYCPRMHKKFSFGGHDVGIFCFEDNSIHPCYYPGGTKKIVPPPVWISPNPC